MTANSGPRRPALRLSVLIMCLLACATFPAYGMKETLIGPVEPIFLFWQPGWPDGIETLLLSPDRVYSVDVNGNNYYYYDAGLDGVNELLAAFAKVDLPVRNVTFRVGAPVTEKTEYGAFRYTVELHLPGGLYPSYAKKMRNETLFPTIASLTVYIDTTLSEQVYRIRTPEGLTVRGVADDLDLIIQGLQSSDAHVRWAAATRLGGLGRAAAPAIEALLKARADTDTGVCRAAESALREIGEHTEDAVLTRAVQDFVRRHQTKESLDLGRRIKLETVLIPSGEFMMGSPKSEKGRGENESPQHLVQIAEPFYMGVCEITQAQWIAVMRTNPSPVKGNNLPVEGVSWYDCKEFCKKLSEKTGRTVRLPSEAEWEYACRAGSTTAFFFGDEVIQIFKYGWPYYIPTSDGKYRLKEVGQKRPNAWGLYDTIGNVMEWCEDVWHNNYDGAPSDGSAWTIGDDQQKRVVRGFTWNVSSFFWINRSAVRSYQKADYRSGDNLPAGFRVVVEAHTH